MDALHAGGRRWKDVGIIGAGKIGTAIAEKCRALGMRVWGVRRTNVPTSPADSQGPFERLLGAEGLTELLAAGDYFVLCAPRTPETVGMLGAGQFAAMKPGTRFINVARGDLVEEQALIEALQSGHLGGAYLDVFERSRCLTTAHSGTCRTS